MKWFGTSWKAPVCRDADHVETPTGAACGGCATVIKDGERGVIIRHVGGLTRQSPWHIGCFLEQLGVELDG